MGKILCTAERFLLTLIPILFLTHCAAHKPKISPGYIPQATTVSQKDERYGQEVFALLAERYKLSQDDAQIRRLEGVVEKLSRVIDKTGDPWHVHLLEDKKTQNAAATRGKHIFVWSGIFETLKTDDHLATVIAHEMGHVLTGHTKENATDEAKQIIAQSLSDFAENVMNPTGEEIYTKTGLYSTLAGMAMQLSFNALFVNPESQTRELEADQIGFFLMSRAGYDPQAALDFWRHQQKTEKLSDLGVFQFLITHPSSTERLKNLERLLPLALAEKEGTTNENLSAMQTPNFKSQNRESITSSRQFPRKYPLGSWRVISAEVPVYSAPDSHSNIIAKLKRGTLVQVREFPAKRWLGIETPKTGFIQSKNLSPE